MRACPTLPYLAVLWWGQDQPVTTHPLSSPFPCGVLLRVSPSVLSGASPSVTLTQLLRPVRSVEGWIPIRIDVTYHDCDLPCDSMWLLRLNSHITVYQESHGGPGASSSHPAVDVMWATPTSLRCSARPGDSWYTSNICRSVGDL